MIFDKENQFKALTGILESFVSKINNICYVLCTLLLGPLKVNLEGKIPIVNYMALTNPVFLGRLQMSGILNYFLAWNVRKLTPTIRKIAEP